VGKVGRAQYAAVLVDATQDTNVLNCEADVEVVDRVSDVDPGLPDAPVPVTFTVNVPV
jgi:hypothetical protein